MVGVDPHRLSSARPISVTTLAYSDPTPARGLGSTGRSAQRTKVVNRRARNRVGAVGSVVNIADQAAVEKLVAQLKSAPIGYKKAKNILRASRLQLLAVDNPHVKSDLAKVGKNKALSPILLVRGDINTGVPLQVADGYHRVCASYHTDENTDIPCRIA
jgi:hypothetical protein